MPVELTEIRDRLKEPQRKNDLKIAQDHEERIRFHCIPSIENERRLKARQDHIRFVGEIINKKKLPKYDTLLTNPHENINLSNEIFTALFRVFDGINSVRNYKFTRPEVEQQHSDFLAETEFYHNWVATAKEGLRGYHNSFLVVDMPEQDDREPEPYFYLLCVDRVIDYEFVDESRSDQLSWIMFYHGHKKDKLAVYDDESYRVFEVDKDDKTKLGSLQIENRHDLEECPASFFIDTPIRRDRISIKRSVLTDSLSGLEWNLFFTTSKKHVDTYGPWPIMWSYAEQCKYDWESEDGHHRKYCENGFLRDQDGYWIERAPGELEPCPVCSKNDLSGSGTFLKVPVKQKKDELDMREPAGVITVPTDNLKNVNDEAQRLRTKLISDVTGYTGPIINNQAINADQVAAFIEKQTAVLRQLKNPLEKAESWLTSIIAKLMFGANFIAASIDYGTEWYIATAEQLLSIYKLAKEAGWSSSLLDDLQDRYYKTKYRNNPEKLARANMLKYIEPFRHLSNQEAKSLFDLNRDLYKEYFLKVNFTSLLNRFELENVPITQFAVESSLQQRVEKIKSALLSYITPISNEEGSRVPDDQPGTQPTGESA